MRRDTEICERNYRKANLIALPSLSSSAFLLMCGSGSLSSVRSLPSPPFFILTIQVYFFDQITLKALIPFISDASKARAKSQWYHRCG